MSGSVIAELAEPLSEAVAALGADGAPVRLERPADPTHGDYASAVAMSLAKPLRSAPREIAGRILERLDSPWVEGAEIAGPGFINLRLTPSWYGHVVSRILAEGGGYGAGATVGPAADPGGVRVRQPDGPGHRWRCTQRRLRRLAVQAVRLRRQRRVARVLLQRRRPPGRPVRRVADGAGARRGGARGRLPRRVCGRDRRRPGAARGRAGGGVDARGHRRDDRPDPGDAWIDSGSSSTAGSSSGRSTRTARSIGRSSG